MELMEYSLPQKKVYTCAEAKYSKAKGTRGKVWDVPQSLLSWSNDGCGAPPTFHLDFLSFEYSARQKCILPIGGDSSVEPSILFCCFFYLFDFMDKVTP